MWEKGSEGMRAEFFSSMKGEAQEINNFDYNRAWEIMVEMAGRGIRPVGSKGHQESIGLLYEKMRPNATKSYLQKFIIPDFLGKDAECANICGLVEGRDRRKTILLGTHFDTRWVADRENDPVLQNKPIPGVNDGASGVAVILELMRAFRQSPPACNILCVLFDAEDIGNLEGRRFGEGAYYFVDHLSVNLELAIITDMIAGRDMRITLDQNSMLSEVSTRAFNRIFEIGRKKGYPAFFHNRSEIIFADHTPFYQRKIPALILMDIFYPQWHTHRDTLENCGKESLRYIGDVLLEFLIGPHP